MIVNPKFNPTFYSRAGVYQILYIICLIINISGGAGIRTHNLWIEDYALYPQGRKVADLCFIIGFVMIKIIINIIRRERVKESREGQKSNK